MSGGFLYGRSVKEEKRIHYETFGDVKIVHGGSKSSLPPAAQDKILNAGLKNKEAHVIQNGDTIVTGNNGYVLSLTGSATSTQPDEHMEVTIYPNSELRLAVSEFRENLDRNVNSDGSTSERKVSGQKFDAFELVKGLFKVSISTKGLLENKIILPANSPKIAFGPMSGKFGKYKSVTSYILVNDDGSISLFGFLNSIIHKGINQEINYMKLVTGSYGNFKNIAGGGFGVKVTLTRDSIYLSDLVEHPDPLVDSVSKKDKALLNYKAASLTKEFDEKSKKEHVFKVTSKTEKEQAMQQALKDLEEAKSKKDSSAAEAAQIRIKQLELISTSDKPVEFRDKSTDGVMEKNEESLADALRELEGSLPSSSLFNQEDKFVVKDVTTISKNYFDIMGDFHTKQVAFNDKLHDYNLNALRYREYKKKVEKGESVPNKERILELMTLEKKEKTAFDQDLKKMKQQKGVIAQTAAKDINISVNYNKFKIMLAKLEKGTEIAFKTSPPGKEFLVLYLSLKSEAKTTNYFYPDEELTLVCESEVVKPEGYTTKTDVDSGQTVEGNVTFIVPESAKKFKVELGKKGTQKLTVEMEI